MSRNSPGGVQGRHGTVDEPHVSVEWEKDMVTGCWTLD